MHPRVYAFMATLTLIPAVQACSDDPRDWVPLVTAIGRAAPVIASAAPVVVDAVKQLTPSPTPTPKPVGLRAAVKEVTIKAGDFKDLLPYLRTFEGDIPTLDEIDWTVSNPAIVSLNRKEGRVKGVSAGQAVVFAFLKSAPKNKAQISLDVLDVVLVKDVSIIPARLSLKPGESRKVQAEVTLASGEINANVNWSSSDDTVARVNPTTGEVSAVAPGRVTIVAAYAADPRYKGLLNLTVTATEGTTPSDGASPAASPAAPASSETASN
ncbi:MAG: Ig-like domain-containing protein [Candidatus Sericytochromatia bacterium]|nr:Ig-like domain-containing protein [Candidatus Sericytochromatia bacterium]